MYQKMQDDLDAMQGAISPTATDSVGNMVDSQVYAEQPATATVEFAEPEPEPATTE